MSMERPRTIKSLEERNRELTEQLEAAYGQLVVCKAQVGPTTPDKYRYTRQT
jgi:hypothetical protein